jgi:hypothetical protein
MSEINRPKEVVSDDESKYLAPELVDQYDFESELYDEEVYEFDDDESIIVDNYNNYIDMSQVNIDATADLNVSTYRPAQVIRVLRKVVRTLPSGQIVVDYDLLIESVSGAKSYELRVLQQ